MPDASRSTTALRRTQSVFAAPVGDQLLLMSVEAGKYFDLNPVAARIWELLEEPQSVENLVSLLTAEYDVDEPTAESEVATFVAALRERGLVAPVR